MLAAGLASELEIDIHHRLNPNNDGVVTLDARRWISIADPAKTKGDCMAVGAAVQY
jgi:hypothetical protein